MAEEIVLVGQFTDNITPKLKKLSKELDNVAKSFTKIQKKLRPITKEMGNLAMASERVADALQKQRRAIDSNTRSWKTYQTAVGKAGRAQRAAFKGAPRGGTAAPRIPRAVGGGGIGGGMALGGFTGGMLGSQISGILTNAIVTGFRIGADLLVKPFQFMAGAIGERIRDEMSDIKAAGGLFAISRRMDNPMVASFREAEQLTKETNRYLAELAGALPGDTQAYIQVAKQISDSVAQIAATDEAKFIQRGIELAQARGEDASGMDVQGAFKEITGNLTKLTVLASGGQGMQQAMGLPMLTEQMLTRANVTMGQFQRYAAIFRDPQIKQALERNIEAINATTAGTIERERAVSKMYEEVVTPEFIRRVSRSTEGVIETVKTAIMNPEVGILGLGRPLERLFNATEGMGKQFDDYGRQLYTFTKEIKVGNKVIKKGAQMSAQEIQALGLSVADVAVVTREAMSIFDYLRDIFANVIGTAAPLLDVVRDMVPIFDALAIQLDKMREATNVLTLAYSKFQTTFEDIANTIEDESARGVFKASISIRSSLGAFTLALDKLGAFGEDGAAQIYNDLKNPEFTDFGSTLKKIIDGILNGPAAQQIGQEIGKTIGIVVRTFADLLSGIFSEEAERSDLVQGFLDGFNMDGIDGSAAIEQIFKMVFDAMGRLLMTAIKTFPKESLIVGAIVFGPTLFGPIIGALGGALIKFVVVPMGAAIVKGIAGWFATTKLAALIGGWLGGIGPLFAALKASLAAVLVPIGLIALKIALVVAAIVGLILIFRNMDFILSSLGEAFKILLNSVMWVGAKLQEGMAQALNSLMQVVHDFASKVGLGWVTGPALKASEDALAAAVENRKRIEQDIAASAQKISENTNASIERTKGDIESMGTKAQEVSTVLGSVASALSSKLGEIRGISVGPILVPTPATPPNGGSQFKGGSVMPSRSYTVGERGPETFVPRSSGTIIPNNELSASSLYSTNNGGGSATASAPISMGGVTVNISGVNDPKAIANTVASEILTALNRATYSELDVT